MKSFKTVGFEMERSGKCLVVRFNRPEERNPLSVELLTSLSEVVDACALSNDIERLVFTGTDDVFASGADLREIAALSPENAREFAIRGQNLMARITGMRQTTIAAVNGYCMGGALDLALACDHRIASPNAQFAHPGTGLGIITGWGGTQRLPRLIGRANALEMFFTAAPIDSEAALRIGLIDKISVQTLETAAELSGADKCRL